MPCSYWRTRQVSGLIYPALLTALCRPGLAADKPSPLVTDRPTDSVAPVVIPKRSLQVEAGYKYSRIDTPEGNISGHVFPELLVRYGLHERFEGRLFTSGWVINDTRDGTEDAFADISIGTKIYLADENGALPQMGLLLDVTLPTGSEEVTSDYVIPKLLFVGAHTLTEKLALTYNVGPSYVTYKQSGQRKTDWDVNYAVAFSSPLTNSLAVFAEIYGAWVNSGDLPDRHNIQAGATVLLSPQVQVDLRIGAGLVSDEPDWFAGAGLAFRLPR